MRSWIATAAGMVLAAAMAVAGAPITTSTTPPSLPSSTTTLPRVCPTEVTFSSILCRLDDLVAVADASGDLARLKRGIVGSAKKARKQCGKAADAGAGRIARNQLKKCAKTIDTFRHKLDSNNAHKLIAKDVRDALRDTLAAPIRADVDTLRGTL